MLISDICRRHAPIDTDHDKGVVDIARSMLSVGPYLFMVNAGQRVPALTVAGRRLAAHRSHQYGFQMSAILGR